MNEELMDKMLDEGIKLKVMVLSGLGIDGHYLIDNLSRCVNLIKVDVSCNKIKEIKKQANLWKLCSL